MSLQITTLDELDTTRVAELMALFSAWMQERHPDVELSRGVFHDLVLYFNSVLNAALRENISRVMQSNSLRAISQNPALAEAELVDNVLSNFNLTRTGGDVAVGEALVVVSQYVATQIGANTKLEANGVVFYPAATITGVPEAEYNASVPNTRLMVAGANNTYVFKVPVVAYNAGAAGNISRGTVLVPDAAPSNVSAIFAAVDFIKGSDPLTNEEYIAKLSTGLAAKTIGGKKSFSALIRAQPALAVTRHISVVGFGDGEQLRDQRGLFPVSGGGRVDIYMQTHDSAQYANHIVTAKYVGPARTTDATSGTIWEVAIDRDLYPGFYAVTRISKIPKTPEEEAAGGSYEITKKTSGFAFKLGEYRPDIQNAFEAAFTRYKQESIQFVDTDTYQTPNLTTASKAQYLLTTVGMPLIDTAQDFLSDADIRCRTADVVVRAAVPCFTSINFTLRISPSDANPTLTGAVANMKTAIVAAISKLGFAGALSASLITNAVAPYLTKNQSIYGMDIFGRILRPDGQVVFIRDADQIVIPTDPANMVSAKTTVFLTSAADIGITIEAAAGFGD